MHIRSSSAALALSLALVGLAQAAQAQEAADRPLADETVRFVVGYGPGGGFDTYARMLAPHFAEATGATVVVDNRPGAGGKTATNEMMREDADGTVLYLMNGVPTVLGQITEGAGVNYDVTELTYLARVNAEPWAVMVNPSTPYETLSDLAEADEPVTFAALSRADGPSDGAAILCESLEIECRIVLGFDGSSEATLSVVRGEADAIVLTDTSVLAGTQGDQARALGVLGERRSKLFPDLGTVPEQVELSEDGAFFNRYRGNIADVGRAIVAPPGMEPNLEAYLRDTWDAILNDPEVVAEGEAAGRAIDYAPGAELQSRIDEIFSAEASARADEIKDVLLNKYIR